MGLTIESEFDLIEHIRSARHPKDQHLRLGIGDDAALIHPNPGWETIVTTDTLVEHIHFDLSYTPLETLGWKSLAINLSDIAAMGGKPVCAVISLGIPKTWSFEMVDQFYQGLSECGDAYHCPIAGGDTVRVPNDSVITVTAIGEVETGKAVLRSGARPGDWLFVTGPLGASKTGLDVLMAGIQDSVYTEAVDHFLKPTPRIREARALVSTGCVTSMIDISDGLASEIRHLCRESNVGCRIYADQIPVACAAKAWADTNKQSPVGLAVQSGEEYELLFTTEPNMVDMMNTESVSIIKIGEVLDSPGGIYFHEHGKDSVLSMSGWDHFHP